MIRRVRRCGAKNLFLQSDSVCQPRNISHLSFLRPRYRVRARFDPGVGIEAFAGGEGPRAIFTREMIGPISYVGGKRALATRLIEIFPPHTTYVEAFCGGAQLFFHKQPSKVEVLNDLDGEIVNFFRVCQLHHEELLRYSRFVLVSRQWFELLRATDPATLTDVQRAARYLYLLKNSFASIVRHPNYHWHVVQPPGFNLERLPRIIENAHKRLERVQIENLPYEKVLAHYDRKESLFYLDPPYFGRKLYRYNLAPADFEQLAERLATIRGKFVLSLNDVPEVRTLFQNFQISEVDLPYTSQKASGRRYRELVITNFKPRKPSK